MMPSQDGRSIGDAIIVVALLLFAAGWLGMWIIGWDEGDADRIKGDAALMAFALVFGPPLWAMLCVWRVVKGGTEPDA